MIINCIAIDDEPLALGLICSFIEKTPFLKLAGSFSSGLKAMEMIQQEQTDLIFLDIQMPDLNGVELARLIHNGNQQNHPRIIFTTAFNNFAIDGYRVDALDYLLKPFNYEEFLRASNKAVAYYELLNQAQPQQPAAPQSEDFIFIKVEYQHIKVALSDILFIEGLKDYAKIYLASDPKPILSLITLKALEEKLPVKRFMRVHRSFIISLEKITAITKNAVQVGNVTINVGDQYKDALKQFLSQWL
ncbi:LytR/AlgR family response regulator transcription factor [Pedobacter metabolipauper]|uniref:LytTR family two component transcriptional regulator n=1 Tax=Pedobacter metabolipauper TaxID=425513 RepID=A0A4R6SSM1_9SPHI|nr:LytTR family DNA-binding domain-containing protein [Pedobacter metabolipauper]TDQ06903.1 LytTR family two component transcriptional regulator [Pedobacter metabolipauper]